MYPLSDPHSTGSGFLSGFDLGVFIQTQAVSRPTHMQKYVRHSAALGLSAAKRKAMCEFVDRLVFHNYQTMCLCVCVCALSSPLMPCRCMYKQGCKSSAKLGIIGSYRVASIKIFFVRVFSFIFCPNVVKTEADRSLPSKAVQSSKPRLLSHASLPSWHRRP